jgi:hypothetical protein
VHNGNRSGHGPGYGNGKRWLLIGLLILGGFWVLNDAYDDGYRDALVQSGEVSGLRRYHDGPDFPWGLLILGGIGYIAWRKGVFDRFGGPGGPFAPGGGNGERGMQSYGAPQPVGGPGPGFGFGFRGPRAVFEEWHRQAHETERVHRAHAATWARQAHTPAAAPSQAAPAETGGNGQTRDHVAPTPPPPPPAPDYWATMNPAAAPASSGAATSASGTSQAAPTPDAPPLPPDAATDTARAESGAAPERW